MSTITIALAVAALASMDQAYPRMMWALVVYLVGLAVYVEWDRSTTWKSPSGHDVERTPYSGLEIAIDVIVMILHFIFYPVVGFKWAWEGWMYDDEDTNFAGIALVGVISLSVAIGAAMSHSYAVMLLGLVFYLAGLMLHVALTMRSTK